MTDTTVGVPTPVRGPGTSGWRGGRSRQRTVGRGVGLPSGRAALGALLVMASVVGLYNASVRAGARPRTTFLVAARDLPPGHIITAADLRPAVLELTPTLAGRAFGAGSRVAGATTLGPLAAGELVQAGALVRSEGGAGNRELSIPIDAARAVAGTLRSGERIDLIVTYGAGSSGTTEVVLRQALVIDVSRPGTGLASKASMVLTLSVPTEADTVAVARALGTGELLVVRAPASGAADPSPVAVERNPASTP